MTDREERRAAAIERGAKALQGVLVHPRSHPERNDYWTHTLDANSRHKVAAAVLDASGLLDDEPGETIYFDVSSGNWPADQPMPPPTVHALGSPEAVAGIKVFLDHAKRWEAALRAVRPWVAANEPDPQHNTVTIDAALRGERKVSNTGEPK